MFSLVIQVIVWSTSAEHGRLEDVLVRAPASVPVGEDLSAAFVPALLDAPRLHERHLRLVDG